MLFLLGGDLLQKLEPENLLRTLAIGHINYMQFIYMCVCVYKFFYIYI